jgi:signal transduction histidine kinase
VASEGPRPPFLLPPRIAPLRSLRIKVLLVVTAVALAPQLLVVLWGGMERSLRAEMEVRVPFDAEQAARVIAEERALHDLRHHLARLGLVTVPLALLLAYWMGRRVVSPIETLRRQALAAAGRVGSSTPVGAAPPLAVRGQDELTDLADAFNTLLRKLQHRQGENERFVADLVHELKNPVAAVRAAAEALGEGAVDDARARRLGKVLLDSSGRLDALVSQFLELARAEAGLASEERAEVDIAALARGLVEAARGRYEAVEMTVDADREALVTGVPHGLDTLLRNLIENAASFALPAEGAAAKVGVEVIPGESEVLVRVTDSGPGIAPEDLDRVFTRFFTTRGRSRGTGLGLALVRATAEAHGGVVRVASEPGSGATFEVALPRAAPA